MTKYTRGSNLERRHCHEAIEDGAVVAVRGAGSKSYGKFKIDTVFLYRDKVVFCQQKIGKIGKTELFGLMQLQKIFSKPVNVEVSVGTCDGITPVNSMIGRLFK